MSIYAYSLSSGFPVLKYHFTKNIHLNWNQVSQILPLFLIFVEFQFCISSYLLYIVLVSLIGAIIVSKKYILQIHTRYIAHSKFSASKWYDQVRFSDHIIDDHTTWVSSKMFIFICLPFPYLYTMLIVIPKCFWSYSFLSILYLAYFVCLKSPDFCYCPFALLQY